MDLLAKFLSRKFLVSVGTTAGAMVLGKFVAPDLLPMISPYLWAGVGIAALYVLVEGVPDAIERVVKARADLIRAQADYLRAQKE